MDYENSEPSPNFLSDARQAPCERTLMWCIVAEFGGDGACVREGTNCLLPPATPVAGGRFTNFAPKGATLVHEGRIVDDSFNCAQAKLWPRH